MWRLAILLCVGCGSKYNQTTEVDPQQAFDKYTIPSPSKMGCDINGNVACAYVEAEDSSVGKSFLLDNLLVKCQKQNKSLHISFNNSLVHSTFSLAINVVTEQSITASQSIACTGPSLDDSKLPLQVLTSEYCTLSVTSHGRTFFASGDYPCTLELTSADPLRGRISCASIENNKELITIRNTTSFICTAE